MNHLLKHFKTHPKMQIQDVFKFLFQSTFGCEHAVSSLETAINYIKEEYNGQTIGEIEQLDGEYSRVPLALLSKGLTAETLGKLFFLSAKGEKGDLNEKILKARELVANGHLPFDLDEFERELNLWKQKGYPAVHHSEVFREEYKPSYRIISNEFVPFLSLFAEIDSRLKDDRVVLAIEGGSASGKTTLSKLIEKVYDCTVFHLDDFFLRPEQRTPERYAEAGGNIDRERFLDEVLKPLDEGKAIDYRRFDCSSMTLCDAVKIAPKKLVVVEGAYSLHPEFREYYDLSVFLDISENLQKERILKRNPQLAERFFDEWIPLEKRYFSEMKIKQSADMVIDIK